MTDKKMKKCPMCAEEILVDAIKCKHCGSMINGDPEPQTVRVASADPFAEYHTPIKGKSKGEITPIGILGIGIGALCWLIAIISIFVGGTSAEGIFGMILFGSFFGIASYLWARRPSENLK